MHTTPSSRYPDASIGTDPKDSYTTVCSFEGEGKGHGTLHTGKLISENHAWDAQEAQLLLQGPLFSLSF